MSKVEEKALKLYPMLGSYDNLMRREGFMEGYHQAEKDLALTWQDMSDIMKIYEDVLELDFCDDTYGEVAKRFHEIKRNQ